MNVSDKEAVKVYGYKRVSTEEQVDGMSLQTQENAIRAYAQQHNLEVIDIFHDDGISAKTAKRPALQDMLHKLTAKDNDVRGVVVYNLSRISRDLESYSRDIGFHLSAHGVRLYSTVENIDDTPEGKLMRNIALSIHQYDNDTKSRTVKDNMRLVALEGWWQGNIPYGYSRVKVPIGVKDKDGKMKSRLTLEPNTTDNLSDKMRMMLERFSKGDLLQSELADYAEGLGLKSAKGERFAPQSIKNILSNIAYAGYVCNKMTDYKPVKGKHPALISLETYNRNQAILEGRKPDEAAPRFTASYPLKHCLLCSKCGKPLTGSAPTNGSGKSSPRYHCTRCTGMGSMQVDKLNILFEAYLSDVTPTDSMIKLFNVITRRIASQKLTNINKAISGVREQITKIDDDMQKALQSMLDGDISKQEKEQYQSSLRVKRIGLEDQLEKLHDVQSLNEATITYVCNFMNTPARMWQDADPETKVEFQKMVTESGITFDFKTEKFGTDGLSMFYRLKDTIKDPSVYDESLMVTPPGIEPGLPG